MKATIYDFEALEFNGQRKSLNDYRGKVLLIVNTASECIFTKQYRSLERLYEKYSKLGLEILAFPSNDFRNQEPLTGSHLETFCRVKQQVTFPVFRRLHVIGNYADPLFKYLSDETFNGRINSKPIWNFHKYLVSRQGEVVDFFYPITSPMSKRLHNKVEELLDS